MPTPSRCTSARWRFAKRRLVPIIPMSQHSLNNLAGLYDDQGRYADAEPLYKRSLAIREKALGPDHPDVATSLNNLAALYDDQGRYADAEPLYKRSLAIREKALGPDHPDVATSLNNLAALYTSQGRYADAEPLVPALVGDSRKGAWSRSSRCRNIAEQSGWAISTAKAATLTLCPSSDELCAGHCEQDCYLSRAFCLAGAEASSALRKRSTDSYEIVQRASSSAAANAVSKLAARFAAGTGELAQLVRRIRI